MDTGSTESRDRFRQAIDSEVNPLEEYTRALKSRRNALAPILRLPPELLASIFSFLSLSAWNKEASPLAWIRIVNVCRRWRDVALNDPRLWSHIDFTKLTPAGMAEILARTKTMPLHLEADVSELGSAWRDAFERQLEAHIFHTRHLSLSGHYLQPALDRLVSSAPTLEILSMSHVPRPWVFRPRPNFVTTPVNLFSDTAPCLTGLELKRCNISWKSPLLKRLRTLEILMLSQEARPELGDWLDALNKITQLETLILQSATPLAPIAGPLTLEPSRAVTLPFLTRFHISDSAKDCALALAHLVLPALTWLHVDAQYNEQGGEDLQVVMPYVARNVSGLQDTEPFRSILIKCDGKRSEVLTWTVPDTDAKICDSKTLLDASVSARFMFAATATSHEWIQRMDTVIIDAILTLFPMNSVSTLSVQDDIQLNTQFWLTHAPRLPVLEQARLFPIAVKAFVDMLAKDSPPSIPRLSSLINLILVDIDLNGPRAYRLRDMLMERVEQGVPLEVLDLRMCHAGDRSIQFLAEIVVEVREPLTGRPTTMEESASFDWRVGIGHWDQVDFYDLPESWFPNEFDGIEFDGNVFQVDDNEAIDE